MTDIAQQDLQATIQAWDQGAWSLAALALAAQGDGPPELTAAARELLDAAGLTATQGTPLAGLGTAAPQQIASQAAAACTKLRRWPVAAATSGAPKATRPFWHKGTRARKARYQ